MFNRRQAIVGALAWPALSAGIRAAEYPNPEQPLRIVIPAPPGGPADVFARAISPALSAQLRSAPVVVENKPGGATIPGAMTVVGAPADGHTVLLTINSTNTQLPHLMAKLPYDPFADFTPITQLFRSAVVVCAQPSLKVANLRELVEFSKVNGPVSAASAGLGTNGHLYIEMLNRFHGAKLNHIPYKGAADAQRDLQAGFVQVYFDSASSAIGQLKGGRIRALAVTGPNRLSALPDLPTAAELGYKELVTTGWFGVLGPKKMAPATVEALNRAFVTATRSPEIRKQFEPMGFDITGTTPGEFEAVLRQDYAEWGRVIKEAGVRTE